MPQEEAALGPNAARAFGAVERAIQSGPRACVVIDGRSGAGKTTFARRVVAATGARLVSLDEFYPGWSGLAAGTRIAERLVVAHASGEAGAYQPWDWDRGERLPERRFVDPSLPFVIEGCGALTPRTAAHATISLWLDGDPARRRRAALARDGDGFAPFWDLWAAQEDEHIRTHGPRKLAALTLDVVPRTRPDE